MVTLPAVGVSRAALSKPRVLLAPVTVTPSKPLTPSHLKGLLWTDIAYRATAQVADVDYRCSHTTYFRTEQTLGFWEFLDRTVGDTDYSGLTEERIGELYVRQKRAPRASADALRPNKISKARGWGCDRVSASSAGGLADIWHSGV